MFVGRLISFLPKLSQSRTSFSVFVIRSKPLSRGTLSFHLSCIVLPIWIRHCSVELLCTFCPDVFQSITSITSRTSRPFLLFTGRIPIKVFKNFSAHCLRRIASPSFCLLDFCFSPSILLRLRLRSLSLSVSSILFKNSLSRCTRPIDRLKAIPKSIIQPISADFALFIYIGQSLLQSV